MLQATDVFGKYTVHFTRYYLNTHCTTLEMNFIKLSSPTVDVSGMDRFVLAPNEEWRLRLSVNELNSEPNSRRKICLSLDPILKQRHPDGCIPLYI